MSTWQLAHRCRRRHDITHLSNVVWLCRAIQPERGEFYALEQAERPARDLPRLRSNTPLKQARSSTITCWSACSRSASSQCSILPANGSPRPWRRLRWFAALGACPVIEEMITTAPPPAVRSRAGPVRTSSEAWPAFRARFGVNSPAPELARFLPLTMPPALTASDHQGRRALPRSRLPPSSARQC